MDGINVLLEYFLVFKELEKKQENNSHIIKEIDKLINLLENAKSRSDKIKYFVDFDLIEKITNRYDANNILSELKSKVKNTYNISEENIKNSEQVPNYLKEMIISSDKGIDSVLYDLMLNLNRYNIYFMNKKVKSYNIPLTADIKFDELDVKLQDVLNYLEVNESEFDKGLLSDLNKFSEIENLKEFATKVKTDIKLKSILYDKIDDKNILLAILLHSNLNLINNIYKIFEDKSVNINKVGGSIPSIFIKDVINSKCKFKVLTHYDNFVKNVELIDKYAIDFKYMSNQPIFLINDTDKNVELISRLETLEVSVKNVLEHVGNILVSKPNIIFNNIQTLSLYGIKLTVDNNNNGYTLLGMEDLSDRLDYLIEKGLWKQTDGNTLDNIDLIRGLIIKDDYLKWKNNYKCDTLDSTSLESEFTNELYNEGKLNEIYEKNPEIKSMISQIDETYWDKKDVFYSIGLNRVSRLRVLRNLCNYNGKGNSNDMFLNIINHKSNINNSEEVIRAIKQTLGMGDESVKLSKGL